jgi:hypothetical protein
MARTKKGPGVTILNKTKVRIKNDMTTMINYLAGRKKLQLKLRYMRTKHHMKMRSAKSAQANNKKRSIVSSLNRHSGRKQTQEIKMSRVMCHVKRSSRIKDPRWLGN